MPTAGSRPRSPTIPRCRPNNCRSVERHRHPDRTAGHLPTLYFDGSYGESASWGEHTFTGNNFSSSFPLRGESRGPTFGLTLRVPIFSGGARVLAGAPGARAARRRRRRTRTAEAGARTQHAQLVPDAASPASAKSRHAAWRCVSARSAYSASQVGLEVGTRTVHRRADQPAEPVQLAARVRAGALQLPAEPPAAGTGRRHARHQRRRRHQPPADGDAEPQLAPGDSTRRVSHGGAAVRPAIAGRRSAHAGAGRSGVDGRQRAASAPRPSATSA